MALDVINVNQIYKINKSSVFHPTYTLFSQNSKKKEFGQPILVRLQHHMHSPAQSHYCLTRALWTAGFPPWPESHLIRQPGHPGFPQGVHVDAKLSADTSSTCHTVQQDSCPQAILKFRPPNSLDYRARYGPQPIETVKIILYQSNNTTFSQVLRTWVEDECSKSMIFKYVRNCF